MSEKYLSGKKNSKQTNKQTKLLRHTLLCKVKGAWKILNLTITIDFFRLQPNE